MKTIKITTGTYNTSDYRVLKNYSSEKAAIKYIRSLGYNGEMYNGLTFNNGGRKIKISIG